MAIEVVQERGGTWALTESMFDARKGAMTSLTITRAETLTGLKTSIEKQIEATQKRLDDLQLEIDELESGLVDLYGQLNAVETAIDEVDASSQSDIFEENGVET